ncbi:AraC family transcriptional regulator [Variovorax sp. J22R133]|uniref:AraC family transcriptional regulator n=1 Tax=Variovorax brevis TaxID=3053503 RepID=UPI0025752705|nr:AraC family transcriptional regulator [Variovorax sp. J22R133]MDM0111117.1 AraC family transcriptional regulator [Variovorax sp. J22R133]
MSSSTRRTTSSTWVSGIASMLASQGLDVQAMFRELDMDWSALGRVEARFTSEELSRLWQLAAQRSGNPAIALTAPRMAQLASFEVLGYAMMSCANLQAGLERLARYLRIVTEGGEVKLAYSDTECRLSFEIFGGEHPVPPQRYEFDLLTFIAFCRWLTGRELHPKGIELAQSAPADRRLYDEAFQCPLRFDAPAYVVLFERADVLRPLPTSNPLLAELHERLLGEGLERLGAAQVSQRAREAIIRKLPEGEPRREEIASALCMSERTLQRRLQDEGTSFQQLLDNTRRELAQQYLRQRDVSLVQATFLLGFADQSIFQRACKRWFNASPGKYRSRSELQLSGAP